MLAVALFIPDKVLPEAIGHHGRQQGFSVVDVDGDRRLGLRGIPGPALDSLAAHAIEGAGGRWCGGRCRRLIRRQDARNAIWLRLWRPEQSPVGPGHRNAPRQLAVRPVPEPLRRAVDVHWIHVPTARIHRGAEELNADRDRIKTREMAKTGRQCDLRPRQRHS